MTRPLPDLPHSIAYETPYSTPVVEKLTDGDPGTFDGLLTLAESLPLTRDHAYRLARNSFAAAFLDEDTKAAYLRQVDDYFATA